MDPSMLKDPAVIGAIMSNPQALQALVSQLQAAQFSIDQNSITAAAYVQETCLRLSEANCMDHSLSCV